MRDITLTIRPEHVRDALIVAALLFAVATLMRQAYELGMIEGRELHRWDRSGGAS